MTAPELPKVLFVDDEPRVLDSLRRMLRGSFDVHTAQSGAEGLAMLTNDGPFPAVVSDMQMPKMDGATFLQHAAQATPDTVRVLLTGHADVTSAIAAVNRGQIFRFLCKPCSPTELSSVLISAIEHHGLVTAERELLERTLRGSIEALLDTLALASPVFFGRVLRMRRLVRRLATAMGGSAWELEAAASLGALGAVTLPASVQEKIAKGRGLAPGEESMVERAADVADRILAKIPRLERVREIVRAQRGGQYASAHAADVTSAARLLKLASDYESLQTQGMTRADAIDRLAASGDRDPAAIRALRELELRKEGDGGIREVPVSALHEGLVLAADLWLDNGVLLVARGYEVTESLLVRLGHYRAQLPERVQVTAA